MSQHTVHFYQKFNEYIAIEPILVEKPDAVSDTYVNQTKVNLEVVCDLMMKSWHKKHEELNYNWIDSIAQTKSQLITE